MYMIFVDPWYVRDHLYNGSATGLLYMLKPCLWYYLVENSLYVCSTFLCNATLYCSLEAN